MVKASEEGDVRSYFHGVEDISCGDSVKSDEIGSLIDFVVSDEENVDGDDGGQLIDAGGVADNQELFTEVVSFKIDC